MCRRSPAPPSCWHPMPRASSPGNALSSTGDFSRLASTADVKLSIFNDDTRADTGRFARRFADEHVLPRLRALHTRVMTSGVTGLSAADDPLVSIGMETAPGGRVTRNCYGVFGLSWLAAEHPEWT